MITGIDHIAIQVRDLDSTVAHYETIFGRAPNWRGGMTGVRQVWFQFQNAALDIIAADGDSPAAQRVRADIDKFGEGLWGLGLTVPKLDEAVHRFARRGLEFLPAHTTMTQEISGKERRWEIAMMKRRSGNGVSLFLVEHAPWPNSPAHVPDDQSVAALDHIVVATENPERAVTLYGGRLGLDLRLDRVNEQWGARQLFFRTGDAVVEVGANLKNPVSDAPDKFGGLAWRVKDPAAAHARIAAAGIDVSELRKGRKPGTQVFTVREGTGGVPTLMLAGNN
ncbi:MAG TPA: VOC family protein [Rhizomicrobium sp.]|nr:VOC family protein [Rhizomicrobium sp.]